MREGIIYGITCTCHPGAGVKYIGQTSVTVSSRRTVHLWNAKTKTSKRYDAKLSLWIREHGADNIKFEEVGRASLEDLDKLEESWISKLREEGAGLLNVQSGGKRARGHKNPSTSEKMRGSGNPMYGKDRRDLMIYARSFQGPPSEETKALWREQRKGEGNARSKLTEEDVLMMRASRTGKYGELTKWAKEFGVSVTSVQYAVEGKTWKHL